MTSAQEPASPARDQSALPLLFAVLGGCAVALVLGLYAKLHHPTGFSLDVAGFSSPLYVKAWLITAAVPAVAPGRTTRKPVTTWTTANAIAAVVSQALAYSGPENPATSRENPVGW